MFQFQECIISLFSQLKEFGLNPKDWYMSIKHSGHIIELTHQQDDDIKLSMILHREKHLVKVDSLKLNIMV